MHPNFVICGLEHTGTTLISELLRQIPGIESGFECGVLLRETPAEFVGLEPFYSNMIKGWGISEAELERCCEADTFAIFYDRLFKASKKISPSTKLMFDKTPRYLESLPSIIERCECPIIASYKDPRAIVYSDFKRSKVVDFDEWYDGYHSGKLGYVTRCYDQFMAHVEHPRVTTVGLEELAMNSRETMERMFGHVGQKFELEYAIINDIQYSNVKSRTVSADIAFEYRGKLKKSNLDRIMKDFGKFAAWFYS